MRPISRSRTGKLLSVLAIGSLCLLACPINAHAEANASDRATARALAGEGYTALKNKDYVTAEDRFRRADELVHAPTLVLDHAHALLGLGRIGEAYSALEATSHEVLPSDAPAVWARAVKDARLQLEALKGKVGWLSLHIKGPSDPHVEIDGQPLATNAWRDRLPETPGGRHIAISAPGFVDQTRDEQLSAGLETEVEIELQPIPEPAPVVVIEPPAPVRQVEPAPKQETSHGRRTMTYVAFGASGVGLAVGAVGGILWLKARSDIKSSCGSLDCQPANSAEQNRFDDNKRRYDTFGTLSGVGFGVGLVGATTGLVLLLSRPKEPEAAEQHAGIRPYVGPGSFGISGAFQ